MTDSAADTSHSGANWAKEAGIVRDEAGYLVTGPDLMKNGKPPEGWPLRRSPYYLETNVTGMFAASDVRHGSVKRCASALGEGAMSVMFVHRYLWWRDSASPFKLVCSIQLRKIPIADKFHSCFAAARH